jgi:hypothetical protein
MQPLQLFGMVSDRSPNHPRTAQVGEAADSFATQAQVGKINASRANTFLQHGKPLRLHITQELQGQMKLFVTSPPDECSGKCPSQFGLNVGKLGPDHFGNRNCDEKA